MRQLEFSNLLVIVFIPSIVGFTARCPIGDVNDSWLSGLGWRCGKCTPPVSRDHHYSLRATTEKYIIRKHLCFEDRYIAKMYEPSFMSSRSIATYAKRLAQYGHPEIDISLDEHNDIPITYTTADSLSGQVSITAPHTARFDEVHITLEGTTITAVEAMSPVASTHSRIEARHPFLKLTMPIPDSEYPQPRIAEAGETYKFPFNFVIPEHLLPIACKHECNADHVHEAHLRLPPTMNDVDTTTRDDLAPDMAKIHYAIKVKVTRTREHDGKVVGLAKSGRKIRVLPTIPEAPPMHILSSDKDYTLSVTKSLRRGMFIGTLGKITVSASQTKALVVSPSSTSASPTILATLKLRFDPAESRAQPPRLGSLTSKIKASTFYAVKPLKNLANRASMVENYDVTRGVYTTTIALASRCVEAVNWSYHALPSPAQSIRRDSGYSTCSSTSVDSTSSEASESTLTPNSGKGKGGWYEADVLVPLTLPSCKTWLPTFHSCLVSRIYCLDLSLSVHTPGTGVPASTISLRLPVQISSSAEDWMEASLGSLSLVDEAVGVEEYLRPRVMSIPAEEFVGQSVLPGHPHGRAGSHDSGIGAEVEAPPGYERFAPGWR